MTSSLVVFPEALAMRLYVLEEVLFVVLSVAILFGIITLVFVSALVLQEGGHRLANWARSAESRLLNRGSTQRECHTLITGSHLHH
jgi:hypothetical protein